MPYTDKQIDLHAKIKIRHNGKIIDTTPGRVILNTVMPDGMPFHNELLNKKRIQGLIEEVYKKTGTKITCKFLDAIKTLGYEYRYQSRYYLWC